MLKTNLLEMIEKRVDFSVSGIYVFEFSNSVFKIGQSKNIYNRIMHHNSEKKRYFKSAISFIWVLPISKHQEKAEKQIHSFLSTYRISGLEHFSCKIEDIIEASKKISYLYKNIDFGPKFENEHVKFSIQTGAEMTKAESSIFKYCMHSTQPLNKIMKILRKEISKLS